MLWQRTGYFSMNGCLSLFPCKLLALVGAHTSPGEVKDEWVGLEEGEEEETAGRREEKPANGRP